MSVNPTARKPKAKVKQEHDLTSEIEFLDYGEDVQESMPLDDEDLIEMDFDDEMGETIDVQEYLDQMGVNLSEELDEAPSINLSEEEDDEDDAIPPPPAGQLPTISVASYFSSDDDSSDDQPSQRPRYQSMPALADLADLDDSIEFLALPSNNWREVSARQKYTCGECGVTIEKNFMVSRL